MLTIRACATDREFTKAMQIVQNYMQWLDLDLTFQGIAEEMNGFTSMYGLPHGIFLLAWKGTKEGESLVGGVGLRKTGSDSFNSNEKGSTLHYHFAAVTVDGVVQTITDPALFGFSFTAVTAPHTIEVVFTLDPPLLSILKDGSGKGTVSSGTGAIFCGATCSDSYPYGSDALLYAVADPFSLFTDWNGGGCSGKDICTVTMSGPQTVTATFTTAPKVKVGTKEFSTVQEAHDDKATTDGTTIRMLDTVDAGSLTTKQATSVTISGGYSADYISQAGSSFITGGIVVRKGTVILDRVIVK